MGDVVEAANGWREQFGYIGRGGVVVIYDGIADAWMNQLRNPERWQPGCVAVDESGRSWTAFGGNERDGALMWLANDPIADG